MKTWMKYLVAVAGIPVCLALSSMVALSATTEQIGISGKQVYTYDTVTGFAKIQVSGQVTIPCIAGESYCADGSYLMVNGGAVNTKVGMTAVTTNTDSAAFTIQSGNKNAIASVTGTGAVTATIKLYGHRTSTLDALNLLCTITLSATTTTTNSCVFTADWPYYHYNTSNVTGTGATVEAIVTIGIAGAGEDQVGGTPCVLITTAATNATNCKASAGRAMYIRAINTTSTLAYLRLYNLAAAPTCSSATGFVESIPVPQNTGSGAGFTESMAPFGQAFSTGIGFCVTGGGSSTDNTNAVASVYLKILYK